MQWSAKRTNKGDKNGAVVYTQEFSMNTAMMFNITLKVKKLTSMEIGVCTERLGTAGSVWLGNSYKASVWYSGGWFRLILKSVRFYYFLMFLNRFFILVERTSIQAKNQWIGQFIPREIWSPLGEIFKKWKHKISVFLLRSIFCEISSFSVIDRRLELFLTFKITISLAQKHSKIGQKHSCSAWLCTRTKTQFKLWSTTRWISTQLTVVDHFDSFFFWRKNCHVFQFVYVD